MTLNLTAKFANPWKGNPKAELGAASPDLDKTLWHPTEDDWKASLEGQRSQPVATFKGFLEIIRQQAESSIERINLLSHGMPELIGFGGEVKKDGRCLINLAVAGGLDEKVIEFHEWKLLPRRSEKDPLTYEEPLAVTAYKLRSRFVRDKAEICLYLCNAGLSKVPLLQHLADILAVKIKAIPEEVCYWIEPGSRGEILRGFTFVRSQGADKRQKGLAHLYNKFITRDPHPLSARDQAMTEP